jgi:hypothetical protein
MGFMLSIKKDMENKIILTIEIIKGMYWWSVTLGNKTTKSFDGFKTKQDAYADFHYRSKHLNFN